jgi:hypothetical protein
MTPQALAAAIATTLAISGLYAALVWVMQRGTNHPGVAYVSSFATGGSALLATVLLVGAAVNLSIRVAPQWLSFGAVAAAITLAFATIHWLRYRIEWDNDGFHVHGLLGGFAARWEQVKKVDVEESWAIQLELESATRRRFQVSVFLVGARAFADAAARKVELHSGAVSNR